MEDNVDHSFSGDVRALTYKGLGVVDHPNGRTFFVNGVWPGDSGLFEVIKQEKNYGFARLKKLIKPSPNRRDIPCEHHGFESGQCGGCPWMMATYDSQVQEKHNLFLNMLKRSELSFVLDKVKATIPSSVELGFRNRAQFKTDGQSLGYVSPGTNILAPIQDCKTLNTKLRGHLQELQKKLPNSEWIPSGKFRWNIIDVDSDLSFSDIQINKKRPFKQANDSQNLKMQNWIQERVLGLSKNTSAIELFCGSGNFTHIFSNLEFQNIFAYELSAAAIEELKTKNYKNVYPKVSNLFDSKSWNRIYAEALNSSVLFLDPPREGFINLSKFLTGLKKIEHIIYVSCNPETYIKDIKGVLHSGFEVQEIQPIDQFPQTPHLEILSIFSKSCR